MAFQLREPFLTVIIMLELFAKERLGQLNTYRFVIDAEKAILQLNAGCHHVERVGDTHCGLHARIMMMIS
jgi:hypothetical protein